MLAAGLDTVERWERREPSVSCESCPQCVFCGLKHFVMDYKWSLPQLCRGPSLLPYLNQHLMMQPTWEPTR